MRLERALTLLAHGRQRSLTDIALECGFGSSSDFSRSFKQRYDVSPSNFDLASFREQRREELKTLVANAQNGHQIDRLKIGENPDGFEVRLRDLPARQVAYSSRSGSVIAPTWSPAQRKN